MSQESSIFLPQLLYLGPQTQYSICSCRGYRNIPKNIKCKHPPEGDLGQIYLGKKRLELHTQMASYVPNYDRVRNARSS